MALTRVSGNLIGQNTVTNQNIAASVQDAYGWRNRIINGDMRIDQRNAGAAATFNNASLAFIVDRFGGFEDTDGVMTGQQDSSAPPGFINSVKVTTTTADASLGATQLALFRQNIEGTNVSDLGWGSANAQAVTLSFWTRSSLTGTFGGSLTNGAQNRAYPFSYTISAANTWEYKTITIPGDTTGTWRTDNGTGLQINFGLGAGSTYSGTAGSWAGAIVFAPTGAVSVIGTLSATWFITGVQLEVGSVATAFERRDFGRELVMCQRYFQRLSNIPAYGLTSSTVQAFSPLSVQMRASPTVGASGPLNYQGDGATNATQSSASFVNNGSTATGLSVVATTLSNVTTGRTLMLSIPTNNGNRLTLNAEL